MSSKRDVVELVKGGWVGDNEEQNFTILCYDIEKKIEYSFNFKGIGKYKKHNERELYRIVELLNQLLIENNQLQDEKDIENAFRLITE